MKFNLQRRDYLLIGGFWLVGCLLLTMVVYYGIFQSRRTESTTVLRPQATFTVVFNQVTAQASKEMAWQHARTQWREDAELLAVTSTWGKTELNMVGQPTAWTYRFYSPAARRMFFVTITPEGEIIGTLHTERLYKEPELIALEAWQMDSPEALSAWLNYGGATMLAAMPGIQVVAQLQMPDQESPLTWTIAGYDRASQNYHSIFINANSREVIDVKSSLQ